MTEPTTLPVGRYRGTPLAGGPSALIWVVQTSDGIAVTVEGGTLVVRIPADRLRLRLQGAETIVEDGEGFAMRLVRDEPAAVDDVALPWNGEPPAGLTRVYAGEAQSCLEVLAVERRRFAPYGLRLESYVWAAPQADWTAAGFGIVLVLGVAMLALALVPEAAGFLAVMTALVVLMALTAMHPAPRLVARFEREMADA